MLSIEYNEIIKPLEVTYMNIKQIIFPRPNCAELIETAKVPKTPYDVVVKTEVSTISPGTERAIITGNQDIHESVNPPALLQSPNDAGLFHHHGIHQ